MNDIDRLTPDEPSEEPISWGKLILHFCLAWAIIWILLNCFLSVHIVPSESMLPTIKPNSIIVSWRLPYFFSNPEPDHGDIITFKDDNNILLIKRVVGLPGDEIELREGNVYLNGKLLSEPYIMRPNSTFAETVASYDIPEGCIFVLGDNRLDSADSRFMDNPYIDMSRINSSYLFSIPLPSF